MGNIQKIETIIRSYKTNIKMGKDLNVHTNIQGHFGMVEQYYHSVKFSSFRSFINFKDTP